MAETIKGLNIKLGLDSTELDEKLTALKGDLKEQQADLKAINNALRYDTSNVDLWKKKQATLNDTLNTTKKRLEVQKQKLDEARRALEVGAIGQSEFNKIERSVMYTEAEVQKLNNELDKTNSKISALGNAKWDKLASVGSTLTKSLTLPIIGATTALVGLSYQAINTADAIGDSASKVYLSAEAYQEWGYACQILAVDQNQLFKAFVKVNAMLGDIANGDVDIINEKLKLIGLTAEDFAGLNTEQAFELLRNALAECGDEATRTAIANEIFGDKLGSELTQVLSATAEEVEALKEEARELGIVSTEDTQIAGAFNDKLDKLKMAISKLQFELAKALLPAMENFVDFVNDSVIPTIKNWITSWNELSEGVKTIIAVVGTLLVAIGPVLTIIGKLVPLIGAIKTAFTATAGAVTIAGTAIKFSTMGWVALIAVIAIILLQNEKFRELLGRIIGLIGDLLSRVMDVVNEVINALMPVIEILLDVINQILDVLIDSIFRVLDPIIALLHLITDALKQVVPIIEEIIEAIIGVLIPVIDIIMTVLDPIIVILNMIIDLIAELIGEITKLISSVLDTLIDIIEVLADVINVVIKIVSKVIELLVKILQPILKIIIKLIEPIIKVIGVIVDLISVLFDKLSPLIETLLKPIVVILEVLCSILEVFEPLLTVICDLLGNILAPVLEIIFAILEPFIDILNAIIDAISWLFNLIFGGLDESTEGVENFSGAFENNMFGAVDGVLGKFGDFFNWLRDAFSGFVSWIGDLATAIGDWFSGVIESVSNWVSEGINTVGNWLVDTWNSVVNWCSDAIDTVGGWISDAWNGITNWFGDAVDTVGGWFNDVGNWFADVFNLNGGSSNNNTTNNNQTNNTTNNVTINTTGDVDIDSINEALGGAY